MSGDETTYKGHVIVAVPYPLAEGKGWTTDVSIRTNEGGAVVVRQFNAANKWKTRDEAVTHCHIFGRQIIDGLCPGLSVSDI